MANIALRNYYRNIERLIEKHDIETASSHCLNILQKYPKDIETYRKLGKIFLEKPDNHVAEKIFKIVLSVFPDDFVANVGLSFIAEQEKRWDDAISFMEYAFEIQPANESLQDELKRLFNRRDGFEPPKIKLTRGALIKMYARSKLYEQAIAEIRLGLYEKPNRVDYKLTLADMLWQSGKHIEAIQNCVEVISRLPYCWDANRILYRAFIDFNKENTDNFYQDRLVELDPYFSFMLPNTTSVLDIPDIAIQINDDISHIDDIENFDWDDFIEKTWAKSPEIPSGTQEINETSWDAILDEAMSGKNSAGSEALPESTDEEITSISSKRDSFINRLQKRSAAIAEIQQIQQNTDYGENTDPSSIQSEEHVSEEQVTSSDIPVFPTIEDESGLVDHDAPVMTALEENKEPIAAAWMPVSEPNPSSEQSFEQSAKPSMGDTQQIRILSDSPEEILLQTRKALEGGNYQFALSNIRKLSEDETYLEEIRSILEEACDEHPQESNLWLALGSIYQRLDLKEKALEVFIRAQKQISL